MGMGINTSIPSQGPLPDGAPVQGSTPVTPQAPATTLGPIDSVTTAPQAQAPIVFVGSASLPILQPPNMDQARANTLPVNTSTLPTDQGDEEGAAMLANADSSGVPVQADSAFAPVDEPQQRNQQQSGDGQQSGDQGNGQNSNQSASNTGAPSTNNSTSGVGSTARTSASDFSSETLNNVLINDATSLGGVANVDTTLTTNPTDFNALFGNVLEVGQETISGILDSLEGVPETPEKMQMINFLQSVSDALTQLKEMLRSMTAFDSEAVRDRTQAQLDTSLANVSQQLAAIKELAEEQQKSAAKAHTLESIGLSANAIQIIVMVVMIIISIPAIIAAGPVGGTIIAAFVVVCIVDMSMKMAGDDKGVFTRMVDGFGKMAVAILDSYEKTSGEPISEETRDAVTLSIKMAMTAVVMGVVIAASPSASLMVCSAGFSSMISACNIGGEIARLAGASETVQNWVEFGVTCGTTIALAVAGGFAGSTGKIADALSETASTAVKNVVGFSSKFTSRYATVAMSVSTAVTSVGLSSANATVNYFKTQIDESIVDIQAATDEETAIKDALVKVLKDIIKKLQEAITGMNDFISAINISQVNNLQNLSNTLNYAS